MKLDEDAAVKPPEGKISCQYWCGFSVKKELFLAAFRRVPDGGANVFGDLGT